MTRKTIHQYGTHLELLLNALCNTDGPVLELGSGDCSTPFLSPICKRLGRTLYTLDSHPDWLGRFSYLEGPLHQLHVVEDWEACLLIEEQHWGLVFVDHAPTERRKEELMRVRNRADIVVVHDTDDGRYNYHCAFEHFAWEIRYIKLWPFTSILSNVLKQPPVWAIPFGE